MASFIYFYSKFTEEFLLLSAAGIFTLLSVYCYHWVIKKRRLGAARNQVPAGMVKVYLNQLINEAQFVRTQLFGLLGSEGGNTADFQKMFLNSGNASAPTPAPTAYVPSGDVPKDLLERLSALETQLAQKEGMVVNVNIEKTKLLEEIENLKQNQKMIGSSAATGDNADLLKKLRSLEERLEEYALFEDDLANLKRLQQENTQLKKRLEEASSRGPAVAPAAEATPPEKEPEDKKAAPATVLDQSAIDALLNGETPSPVSKKAAPAEATTPAPLPSDDSFEKLVDSVENSLEKAPPAPIAAAPVAEAIAEPVAAPQAAEPVPAPLASASESLPTLDSPAPSPDAELAAKTDEELLREFENLLNS